MRTGHRETPQTMRSLMILRALCVPLLSLDAGCWRIDRIDLNKRQGEPPRVRGRGTQHAAAIFDHRASEGIAAGFRRSAAGPRAPHRRSCWSLSASSSNSESGSSWSCRSSWPRRRVECRSNRAGRQLGQTEAAYISSSQGSGGRGRSPFSTASAPSVRVVEASARQPEAPRSQQRSGA